MTKTPTFNQLVAQYIWTPEREAEFLDFVINGPNGPRSPEQVKIILKAFFDSWNVMYNGTAGGAYAT
jgi:hypothetical protein